MKKKTTAAEDAYVRVPGYAELLAGIHLPAEVWAVFAQCDAPRRPAEIARLARLEEAEVLAALRRLVRRRLVHKHELDWHAYLASQGAPEAPAAPPQPAVVSPTVAREPAPLPISPPAPAPVYSPAPAPASACVTTPPFAPPRILPPAHEPVSFTLSNSAAAEARRRTARDVLSVHICRAQPAGAGMIAA